MKALQIFKTFVKLKKKNFTLKLAIMTRKSCFSLIIETDENEIT